MCISWTSSTPVGCEFGICLHKKAKCPDHSHGCSSASLCVSALCHRGRGVNAWLNRCLHNLECLFKYKYKHIASVLCLQLMFTIDRTFQAIWAAKKKEFKLLNRSPASCHQSPNRPNWKERVGNLLLTTLVSLLLWHPAKTAAIRTKRSMAASKRFALRWTKRTRRTLGMTPWATGTLTGELYCRSHQIQVRC